MYFAAVPQRWSKKLIGEVRIDPTMERVDIPTHDCDCADDFGEGEDIDDKVDLLHDEL